MRIAGATGWRTLGPIKLVSCFHNLRLLKRMAKTNYTEPAVGWTEEDTTSGITKYGIVNYE